MANPFQNASAGALDLLWTIPDLASLPFGLYSGLKSTANGGEFWKGFAENPFIQANSKVHEGITNLTGADETEDSPLRLIASNADMLVGAGLMKGAAKTGIAMAKDGVKEGLKTVNKQAIKNSLKEAVKPSNLVKNTAEIAATNYLFDALTPGEVSNTTQNLGLAGLGYLGLRAGRKKLKGYQTMTDVWRQLPQNDWHVAVENEIKKAENFRNQYLWKGEKESAIQALKLYMDLDDKEVNLLRQDTKKIAETDPLVKDMANWTREKVNALGSVDNQYNFNKAYAIQQELGSRVGAFLAKVLPERGPIEERLLRKELNDNGIFDFAKKYANELPVKGYKGESTQKLINTYVELCNNKLSLDSKYGVLDNDLKNLLIRAAEMRKDSGMLKDEDFIKHVENINNGSFLHNKEYIRRKENTEATKASNSSSYERSVESGTGMDEQMNPMIELQRYARDTVAECMENERKKILLPKIAEASYNIRRKMFNEEKVLGEVIENNQGTQLAYNADRLRKALANIREDYSSVREYDAKMAKESLESRRETPLGNDGKYTNQQIHNEQRSLVEHDLENKTNNKDRLAVESQTTFFKDGKMHGVRIGKAWMPIFYPREYSSTTLGRINKNLNNMATVPMTGWVNPFFSPRKFSYGVWEMMPALITVLKNNGFDAKPFEVIKTSFDEFGKGFKDILNENIARAVESSNGQRGTWFFRKSPEYYRSKIAETIEDGLYVSPINVVDDVITNSNMTKTLVANPNNIQRIFDGFRSMYHTVDKSFPFMVLHTLSDAINDSTARTIGKLIRSRTEDPMLRQKMADEIRLLTTDSTRRLSQTSATGKILDFIQQHFPYGPSIVQGFGGKMNYVDMAKAKIDARWYVRDAMLANKNDKTAVFIDSMVKMAQVLNNLDDNITFNVLWKTVAVPTALCYIWNNMSAEQSKSYHDLSPSERSNKLLLTNFAGHGINVCVPMDQEWGLLKNLFEGMLDSVFNLSSLDISDPAFSYKDQIAWSIGQDLGVSLPVGVEAIFNASGIKHSIDPTVPFTDANLAETINKYKYKNMDPEFAEVLQTLTSKLGKIIVNIAEDRPVMDFRYAIPFMQVNPKVQRVSDTDKFLRRKFKQEPNNQVLKSYYYQKQKLQNEMKFYEANGVDKNGRVLGDKKQVLKDYQSKIDKLIFDTYNEVS